MNAEFEDSRARVLSLGGEGPNGDLDEALVLADFFAERNSPELTATALDVAFGLDPSNEAISKRRQALLESFTVIQDGLVFRYVPAGTFLMGSELGDRDESPVHPVLLDAYWMADIPTSWSLYCRLMGWKPPPEGMPEIEWTPENRMQGFHLHNMNKIRMTYCETGTLQGRDWHAHATHQQWRRGGQTVEAEELFGAVQREDPDAPETHDVKPMVAVGWQEAEDLCERLTDEQTQFVLPSEAQWEKAARGGLIQQTYTWGSEPPDDGVCDFEHFGDWVIHDPRRYPPNGYGIHGMCGTVWEWTRDLYDSLAYSLGSSTNEEPDVDPSRESDPNDESAERMRTLRGGSWIDCAEAVTVSFRMCRGSKSYKDAAWGGHGTPTIGFRLCRTVKRAH